MEVRVYYEDTDCGGVVYYANYLKYFERARTRYLEERGFSVGALLQQGIRFLVSHAEVTYRSPARYGETLAIETTVTAKRRISLTFHHTIREGASQRVIVEGSATLVTVDGLGKVKRLNRLLVEALGPSVNISKT